jgi:PBSX family phage portal protein
MESLMTEIPFIDARMADEIIEEQWAQSDPFTKSWDDIKGYAGLENNFKRRQQRAEKAAKSELEKNNVPRDRAGNVSPTYLRDSKATNYNEELTVASKQINPGLAYRNGYGIFDVITPPYNMYELSSYYDTSFSNHAAIDAKVANSIGMGFHFEMTPSTLAALENMEEGSAKDKAKRRIERLKHELTHYLESCNNEDNFIKVLEKVVTDMQATGNGYIEIGRTTQGDIGYIGHIPAPTVRVRRLRDGFVQIIAGSVTYFRNFGANNPNPVTSDPRPNEVLHLKEYSPLNTFYGVPDVVSALSSLKGDAMAQQYNIDYFQNKAVPRYVITVKGAKLSAEAEDKLFRFFQTSLRGQNHRTLYVPLPPDTDGNPIEFKMEPIENTVQDASFDKYRSRNRDDILMAHQVPMTKLGMGGGATISNGMQLDRTFRDQVARPLQQYVAKFINAVVEEKTDVLQLVFNQASLTDDVAMSQINERYAKVQVMTPNEIRESIGLPQINGGDEMFQMSAKQQSDTRANLSGNRERDSERNNNQSDGEGAVSGRNPAGAGPKTD